MALFKRKKKKGVVEEPPEFLEYPKFPESEQYRSEEDIPNFPEERSSPTRVPRERIIEWQQQEEQQVEEPPARRPRRLTREVGTMGKRVRKGKVMPRAKALFIRVEKFKEIIASVSLISRKISEMEDVAQKIKEIKSKEDSEIADWQNQLNEIKARLEKIEAELESKI
jgi:hypothetical protein